MQNFTPISVTIAEISVSAQTKKYNADDMSDKMHASIAFVDNYCYC